MKLPTKTKISNLAICIFFALLVVGGCMAWLVDSRAQVHNRDHVIESVKNTSRKLQRRINNTVGITHAIASHVRKNDGSLNDFDELIQHLREEYTNLDYMVLAPDGIIKFAHPKNKNLIDLDVQVKYAKASRRARRSRKPTSLGLVKVKNGKTAFASILPVHLRNKSGNRQFWGFVAVGNYVSNLIKESQLESLADEGYYLKLSSNDDPRQVIYKSVNKKLIDPVTDRIKVADDYWALSIMPVDGWRKFQTFWFTVPLMLLVAGLTASYSNLLIKRTWRLNAEVDLHTKELSQTILEMEKAKELSDAINMIDREVNSTSEPGQMMDRVVQIALKATHCDSVAIGQIENHQMTIKHIAGFLAHYGKLRLELKDARAGTLAIEGNETLVINDYLNDPRASKETGKMFSLRSFLAAPLRSKNESYGFLVLIYNHKPVVFTKLEIDFAEKVGASLSLAIENAQLLEEQQNIAHKLQEALILLPDEVAGVDFNYLYKSVPSSKALAGGDFYDLFELDNDRVGVTIGDVSGKGLDTVAITAATKNSIRAFAWENLRPDEIIAKADKICCRSIDPSIFVTVIFGILEKKTGRFTFCNAGHPPAIALSGETVTCLPTLKINLPLGIRENSKFSQYEWELGKEDTLFLYTDGLTETRNKNNFFGEQELVELLKEANSSLDEFNLPLTVFKEIIENREYRQVDDIAIISLSRKNEDLI